MNSYRQIRSPKYRPPIQKDIFIPPEQRPRCCEIYNYTYDEDFEENDFYLIESDFGIEEEDIVEQEYLRYSVMGHRHNFDCCVNTDSKNGIIKENGIDEVNWIFWEEADNNENEHFL